MGNFLMDKIRDIKKALNAEAYLSALGLTLTIPDICGGMEFKWEKSEIRYKKWYKKYLSDFDKDFLSAEICYQLRCAYLHEGVSKSQKYPEALKDFKLTSGSYFIKGESNFNGIISESIELPIPTFCEKICDAAQRFYEENPLLFREVEEKVCLVHKSEFTDGSSIKKLPLISNSQPEKYESNSIVYHYTSTNAFLSIIGHKKLHLTDSRYLNDKMEGKIAVRRIIDFCRERENQKLYPNFIRAVENLFGIDVSKGIDFQNLEYVDKGKVPFDPGYKFVFCASKEQDSLPMWNYYLHNNQYEGFNIGFQFSEIIKQINRTGKLVYEDDCRKNDYGGDENSVKINDPCTVYYGNILYDETDQMEEIRKLAISLNIIPVSLGEMSKSDYDILMIKRFLNTTGFFFKDDHFRHEVEFRLLVYIDKGHIDYFRNVDKGHLIRYKNQRGMVVPYLEISFPEKAVKEVSVSPVSEFEIVKEGIDSCLKANNYNPAKINQSEIPVRF